MKFKKTLNARNPRSKVKKPSKKKVSIKPKKIFTKGKNEMSSPYDERGS